MGSITFPIVLCFFSREIKRWCAFLSISFFQIKFVQGDSGRYGLYILGQTGFVKSGSHLDCLHANVGETIKIFEY